MSDDPDDRVAYELEWIKAQQNGGRPPGGAWADEEARIAARADAATVAATEALLSERDPLPREPWTELGYAHRFVTLYGDRVRYVGKWNRWLVWDGVRWARDDTGRVVRLATILARRLTNHAMHLTDTEARKQFVAQARKQETSHSVSGVLRLAAAQVEVAIGPDDLDAHPFLLNCANGVLDLRTGALGGHDPALLLTRVTRAAFKPSATGPTFAKFLADIQPDPAMRSYLGRLLGHALEGRVTEHVLPILQGGGANGKSTLVDAVVHALGDYAAPADPELLTAKTFDAHPTGVADLFGLRLAVVHETERGRRLAEGTVKRLTGGDRVKARRMREDFWSFDPSHTFVMLTNHRPLVAGTDEGIWRRLRLVPFPVTIPAERRDENLPSLLEGEADAVLAFLVGGYETWSAGGLDEPREVLRATEDYRSESDALARFLDARCFTGSHHHARSSELYSAWQSWCQLEGEEAGTNKSFTTDLQNRGFDTQRTKVGIVWQGIGLAAEGDG